MERFLTPVKINGHAERQNQIWMNENEEIATCNLAQLESLVSLFSLSIRLYVWWITLMLFPLFHFLQCFIFIYFIYMLKRQELKLCFKHRGNTVMQNWTI